MKESRHWKWAFEPKEDVETPYEKPRVELTRGQKAWLGRAWGHTFGFIPNAIPIYNESEGFAHRPGVHIHWHHIVPIGEMTRMDGVNSHHYNNPRNIVPIESFNHNGQRA